MKFLYFPGCKIPAYLPQYDQATRAIMARLGVTLIDSDLNCCGYPVRHRSLEASVYSAARILASAARRGLSVLTPCKCCYGNLRHAQYWMHANRDLKAEVNRHLSRDGLRWCQRVGVKHLLSVLKEDVGVESIQETVTAPFRDTVGVAVHYGCHALRPANVTRFDNPLAPTIFETLVAVTGARPVDWPLRLECCGAPLWEKDDALSNRLMQRKLTDARNSGADILCTACTYCQIQFDRMQARLPKEPAAPSPLPAVVFPQLLGLAMGIDRTRLGMDLNRIPWR